MVFPLFSRFLTCQTDTQKIPYNIAFNSSENNPTEENLKKLKKVVDKQSYIAYNQSSGTDRAKKKQF